MTWSWNSHAVGYHGCDWEVARAIVLGDAMRRSENSYDWLGQGINFWEDDPARALKWAEEAAQRPGSRIKQPAVLGALIDFGNCLNLIQSESANLVTTAYKELAAVIEATGRPMPRNTGRHHMARHLDCAVIEYLHSSRVRDGLPAFDSIRAFFIEGSPIYPGAGLRALDHIQVCVRNPQIIRGYFLPR